MVGDIMGLACIGCVTTCGGFTGDNGCLLPECLGMEYLLIFTGLKLYFLIVFDIFVGLPMIRIGCPAGPEKPSGRRSSAGEHALLQ